MADLEIYQDRIAHLRKELLKAKQAQHYLENVSIPAAVRELHAACKKVGHQWGQTEEKLEHYEFTERTGVFQVEYETTYGVDQWFQRTCKVCGYVEKAAPVEVAPWEAQ